ncbi:MAG: hypothetical protein AB1586_12295 [Pseudomonadota bacterium]
MVDDTPKDNGPASETAAEGGRRPRTPPTIDLEASRVETAVPPSTEQPVEAEGATEQPSADMSRETPGAAPRPRKAAGLLAAVLAGAVGALVVGGVGWFAGVIGNSNALSMSMVATVETLAARVARLESAPAPAVAAKHDPALAARLDGMEKSLGALRDNLMMLREQVERAVKTVDNIKAAPAEAVAATPPDLSAFDTRLAQLDTRLQALAAQTSQLRDAQGKADGRLADLGARAEKATAAKPADDIPLRRAIAAGALDAAVRGGESFAPALAAAKRLAQDPAELKPLDAFATAGVPSAASLGLEFVALRRALAPALDGKPTPAPDGWLDRLRTSAERLVKIRRNDAAGALDDSGPLARGAAAVTRGDLAAARREFASLPEAERGKVQPWLDKVAARDAALAASRQFTANAISALTAAP